MSDNLSVMFAIAIVIVAIVGGPILIMRMAEYAHDREHKKSERHKNDRT